MTYVLMHGATAAALGTFWRWKVSWALSIPAGALLRMAGQLAYLVLSSFTMNENLFAVVLANVHSLLVSYTALHIHEPIQYHCRKCLLLCILRASCMLLILYYLICRVNGPFAMAYCIMNWDISTIQWPARDIWVMLWGLSCMTVRLRL
jgi:hypothetical protein